MEIKVKKIGEKQGTVGWLAKGLGNGTLTLDEGYLKAGNHHGLWLKNGGNLSQFLAAFNQYDEEGGACYDVADNYEVRLPIWTDAAWESLLMIAQKWCDQCNEVIEKEEVPEIKIVRVSA